MIPIKLKSLMANSAARNSAIVFIGTMVANFGAYLYQVIVVRLMGPERYSEFAALLSLLFLLSVPANVLQLVLTKYFSVYKATDHLGESRTLFIKSLKIISIVSVVGFILYLPVIPLLQNLLHIRSFDSFLYLYFIIVGSFLVTCCGGLLNGYQKFFASNITLIILTGARVISGLLFASISVSLSILGNAVSNAISLIFFFFSIKFVLKAKPEKIRIKKSDIWKFAVPTFLSTLGMTAFFNMDVVLVKHFFDATQSGIYASLTIFGKIIFFAASPVMIVIFPMIIERKEQKKDFQTLFLLGALAVGIMSAGIVAAYFISAAFVTKLLFGEKFSSAAPYLGIYGIFMALVTAVNYLMTVCLAVNKTKAGILVLSFSIIESVVILFFHSSLTQVITGISIVTGLLMGLLLIYYVHEPRNT